MPSPIPKFRSHLRLIALLSLIGLLILALPDAAHAGRYLVAQCDPANRAFADAAFERRNGGDYGFAHRCEEDEDASSLQIYTITRTPQDHFGRISWGAPAGSRIVGVALEARLRSDAGQQARVSFTDPYGVEVGRIATGPRPPAASSATSGSSPTAGVTASPSASTAPTGAAVRRPSRRRPGSARFG